MPTTSYEDQHSRAPIERVLEPPTLQARYTCAAIVAGIIAVWGKLSFDETSTRTATIHSWLVPTGLILFYMISLPMLRLFTQRYLENVSVKLLLRESMVIYNAAQVLLNGWIVYRILHAVLVRGHPFIGGDFNLVDTGAAYAVWIHYCNKYLEFFDTYFMVLRGRMDQVTFLHTYHHTSIAMAWWIGIKLHPGGDIYFGALINSWIHVMMYSYYTLSLLRIQCPWKKYLTIAQLTQFVSVLAFSAVSIYRMPSHGKWQHYLCHVVQDFEMTSLFVLFMHFYRKAYSKRFDEAKKRQTSSDSATTDSLSHEQESISSDGSVDE